MLKQSNNKKVHKITLTTTTPYGVETRF